MNTRRGAAGTDGNRGFRPAHLMLPIVLAVGSVLAIAVAQQPTVVLDPITKGERPSIAIPDFRGAGEAQGLMSVFNQTVWGDVSGGGVLKMLPKTSYPTTVPQQPSDFTQPTAPVEQPRGR